MPRGVYPRPDRISLFWSHVQKTDACWLWTGSLSRGYGVFRVGDRNIRPHRFAYELLVKQIPEGLVIDHLCRVRNCVNPEHLEPVTIAENLARGETINARNAAKTHCPKGHPYDGENLFLLHGRFRRCRICGREAWRIGANKRRAKRVDDRQQETLVLLPERRTR